MEFEAWADWADEPDGAAASTRNAEANNKSRFIAESIQPLGLLDLAIACDVVALWQLCGFSYRIPVVAAGEKSARPELRRLRGCELVRPGNVSSGVGAGTGGLIFGVIRLRITGSFAPFAPAFRDDVGRQFRIDEDNARERAPGAAEADGVALTRLDAAGYFAVDDYVAGWLIR